MGETGFGETVVDESIGKISVMAMREDINGNDMILGKYKCIRTEMVLTQVQEKLSFKINAVCALQINCKLLPFPSEKSCRNEQMINRL